MAIRYDDLPEGLKARIQAADERDRRAKQKRHEQGPLVSQGKGAQGMVDIPGELLIRITRRYSGRRRAYDDDNMSGGCKELRDAIAAELGRSGDSKEDGLTFIYAQERAKEQELVIEVFQVD